MAVVTGGDSCEIGAQSAQRRADVVDTLAAGGDRPHPGWGARAHGGVGAAVITPEMRADSDADARRSPFGGDAVH